jgi:sugar O-acyltransferase (sialic acid O-acetyltransferase NeuD family)
MPNPRRSLFGNGGFARDIRSNLRHYGNKAGRPEIIPCIVDEEYWEPNHEWIRPFSEYSPGWHIILIAVADPWDREQIAGRLGPKAQYWTFKDFRAHILDDRWVSIGKGSALCAGSIIVCNSTIGDHFQINLNSTVGHDTHIGDFVTISPGVNISGDCTIGNRVFFGTNSCCREKLTICDDVTIGMGAVVVKDITEPGTYIGCPARKVENDRSRIDIGLRAVQASI